MLRYVAEAPLIRATDVYNGRAMEPALAERYRRIVGTAVDTGPGDCMTDLRRQFDELKTNLQNQAEELGTLRTMVADDVDTIRRDLVRVHRLGLKFVKRSDKSFKGWHTVATSHPAPPK